MMNKISIHIPRFYPPEDMNQFVYYLVTQICDRSSKLNIIDLQREYLVTLASRLLIEREEAQAIAVAYSDSADDYCCLFSEYAFGKWDSVDKIKSILGDLQIIIEITAEGFIIKKVYKYCEEFFMNCPVYLEENENKIVIYFGIKNEDF